MKIIEDYCIQPRRYADSEGWLKIELEEGDDRCAIIEKYNHHKRGPLDYACTIQPQLCTKTLLVFKRTEPFLD